MQQNTTTWFDGTMNAGRKGIAYDWHSLLANAEAARLDHELAELTPQLAR
ncbi:MAG: hypothetical protein HZB15_03755 [Actinobacteria bacterium]|nr:hypothetical protein [Actinomycetota bacterium]